MENSLVRFLNSRQLQFRAESFSNVTSLLCAETKVKSKIEARSTDKVSRWCNREIVCKKYLPRSMIFQWLYWRSTYIQ